MRQGNLFCISGPAGVGKGTLVDLLRKRVGDVWLSVSATTRKPRKGEVEAESYFFLSDADFDKLVEDDGLLEWACVHEHRYGTPKAAVLEHMGRGEQVVLEIEPQGASQVKAKIPSTRMVFIVPPSPEELERRLKGRGTEDAHQIKIRLETAKVEMERRKEYDVVIVNDDIDVALSQLVSYVEACAGGRE